MAGSKHIKSPCLYLGNFMTKESTSLAKLEATDRLQPEQTAKPCPHPLQREKH